MTSLAADVFQAFSQSPRSKDLADVRQLRGHLSIAEAYFVVTEDSPKYRFRGINRVAIVDRKMAGLGQGFLELVAQNSGYRLRVFVDPGEALDWLLDRQTDRGIQMQL